VDIFHEIVPIKFHSCSYETAFSVLIYITPPKNNTIAYRKTLR